jgi:hypothetical protein
VLWRVHSVCVERFSNRHCGLIKRFMMAISEEPGKPLAAEDLSLPVVSATM